MIHIGPEANLVREFLPHSLVFPDRLLALFYKGLYAVLLDLFLAVETEFFFDSYLHGQTVRIPACFSRYILSLHCLVSWNHILYYSGKDMTYMRFAVCGGRSVIKCIYLAFLPGFHGLIEYVLVFPEFCYLFLTVDKIHTVIDFSVHLIPPVR